jgi:hypothetical protein
VGLLVTLPHIIQNLLEQMIKPSQLAQSEIAFRCVYEL